MNPSLIERFLGPSTDFFLFNQQDANISVTPIEKKTCLLTKRNVIATTIATSAALAAINNCTKTNPGTKTNNPSYSASKLKPYKGSKTTGIPSKQTFPVEPVASTTDTECDTVTYDVVSTQNKLSSSSYTIINKSSFLTSDSDAANVTLPEIANETHTLNNEPDESKALCDDKSDRTLNSEDLKSIEDYSIISDVSSDIEDCKRLLLILY